MINTNYYVMINDEIQPISVTYIHDDGNVHFQGPAHIIQRLIKVGGKFEVYRKKNDEESGNGYAAGGEILKVQNRYLFDVAARKPNEAAEIVMEAETICKLDFCKWFVM